jgi:hypothetical protein
MRLERPRAACARCYFAGRTCRVTYFGTVAASMLQAALDKCRSYLSFMDRTAARDASNNNRRNQQRLKRRLLNLLKQFTVPPATMSMADEELRSSLAARHKVAALVGIAANLRAKPCSACSAPVREWASTEPRLVRKVCPRIQRRNHPTTAVRFHAIVCNRRSPRR